MSAVPPPDIAGVSLTAPRLRYEIEDRPWGSAAITRAHAARSLEGATIAVRLAEGDVVATFELKSFIQPPVQSYLPPPATAWRGLLVEHALLARPELVWAGAFPAGWGEGLAAPWVAALRDALGDLHRRYTSLVRPLSMDYALRQIECAECCATRMASVPARTPGLRFLAALPPPPRCPHGPDAMRALGELCPAHPELTFELLGWLEPAGARLLEEGPTPSRFVLTGPVMEALLGPWLVGDEQLALQRTLYRGYDASRRTYRSAWAPEPPRPSLHRHESSALALAASAWGYSATAEALITGNAAEGVAAPALEPAAAPAIDVPIALPGAPVRGKAARARAARKKRRPPDATG